MEHLLFIDDERFFARQYSRELEPSYRVTLCQSITEGAAALDSGEQMDAVILDIQMPTPADVPAYETADGVDTGIWFLRTYRDFLVDRSLPILILTNRRVEDIEKRVRELRFPSGQVEAFFKGDVSPRDFAVRVTTVLRGRPRPGPRRDE